MTTKIKVPIVVKGDNNSEHLGLVHIYTGDGKGKTTSSLGLAMRAAGNNLNVHVVQFLKSGITGEINSAKKLGFSIEQFGVDAVKTRQKNIQEFMDAKGKFTFQPDEMERESAMLGLLHAKDIINSGRCDMVILDEINCVLDKKLIPIGEVVNLMKNHGKTELVLTGRDVPKELFEFADYVTVMQKIKHPWDKKIKARLGVEY